MHALLLLCTFVALFLSHLVARKQQLLELGTSLSIFFEIFGYFVVILKQTIVLSDLSLVFFIQVIIFLEQTVYSIN